MTKTSKWNGRFSFENLHGKRKTVALLYTSRLEHLKTGSKHNPPERFTKTKSRRETYVSRKMAVSGNVPDGLGSITEHITTSVETTVPLTPDE